MTETNETTTEPTTLSLHERLVARPRGYHYEDSDSGYWLHLSIPVEDLASIQSAIEDDATRPLREEVERLKDRVAWVTKERDAWQMDTIAARTKHNALKARADAMRSSLQWVVDGHTPLASEATEATEEHIDSVQAVIDGEPGALEKRYAEYDVSWTPDGMQTQIDEIRDCVIDLERFWDSDVATYCDRFNQQQRQIDSIRGGMATDKIESNEQTDRIGQVVDHVQFRLKNVEDKADALEALHAPDPNQDPALQARPCRERIDDLVTLADVAGAASDRMDAIERRHGKLRKQHRRDYDGLLTSLDTLGHRVEALEAERDPGAGPTVVTEAMCEAFVDAANSCRDPSPYAHIRAGLAAALKAGGAK